MAIQLTEDQYFEMAKQTLASTGRDIVAEGLEAAQRAIADCKRVHRLLAVDGRKPEELTTAEQFWTKPFENVTLAVVEEISPSGKPSGVLLPAVELTVEPVAAPAKAPTAPKAEAKKDK